MICMCVLECSSCVIMILLKHKLKCLNYYKYEYIAIYYFKDLDRKID